MLICTFHSMTTCRQLQLFPSDASRYRHVKELGIIPGVLSRLLFCYMPCWKMLLHIPM